MASDALKWWMERWQHRRAQDGESDDLDERGLVPLGPLTLSTKMIQELDLRPGQSAEPHGGHHRRTLMLRAYISRNPDSIWKGAEPRHLAKGLKVDNGKVLLVADAFAHVTGPRDPDAPWGGLPSRSEVYQSLARVIVKKDALLLALLAHSMEDFQHDPRENVIKLAIVHHVALKIGVKSGDLFARVCSLSSPGAAESLAAFSNRSDALKSLETMRFKETDSPQSVCFVPI